MPEKLWAEMTVDEKLEWLHASIQGLANTGNANIERLEAGERSINQRLEEVEAEVRNVAAEVRHPQRHDDGRC
jgi:hypothetical protein